MDFTARQDQIRSLIADAPRAVLAQALLDALDASATAQAPLDFDDYGQGGCLDHDVVQAGYDARSTVGDDVDSAVLDALLLRT